MKKSLFLLLALLTSGVMAMAQTASGVVLDASNGEPIIGANVIEKGTTNGTITDFDGNFVLIVQPGAVIQVSYMGYKTQELPAAENMRVQLGEDSELLDEVVVVGYGTVRKNDATGSVTAIKPDEMNKGLTTNAQEMLQGKVAGVLVTSDSGTPGGGSTIRIRGGSSLSASNDPLIVIDGLAMDNNGIQGVANPLSMINPNDIESFTVLKDASATAIYGSRASNGVIIITTKKGSQGQKMKVNYAGNVSVSTLNNTLKVMTADELMNYAVEQSAAQGITAKKFKYFGEANTDWQREIYRPAISTDHSISITGGTKHLPYRASIGYTLQNGIIKTSQMQRVTADLSLNPTFLDKHLSFNLNAKGMYIYNRYADGGVVGSAIAYDPTCPVTSDDPMYTAFGGYFQRTQDGSGLGDSDPLWNLTANGQAPKNPVAMLEQKNDRANSGAFVGSIEADYKIHGFEDLRLHANFGADYSYGKQVTDISPYSGTNHYYGYQGWQDKMKYNLSFNCYAQYYKDWENAGQHFDAMVGYEWQHFYNKYHSEGGGVYPSTNKKHAGEQKDFSTYNSATENYLVSFFGRINWSGWNQVLLTATFRADGSSRFHKDNRWGYFPSVALGWKIKETFFRDNNTLSDFKLRLGYGITGQQNINQGDYPYLPVYVSSREGAYSTSGELVGTGLTEEQKAAGLVTDGQYIYYPTYRPNEFNAHLTWEKTTTYNAGIDLAFLNNRVNMNIDYYYRITNDLINTVDIPAGTNFKTRVISNIGSLFNQGVEFSINAVAIDRKNFKWDLGFNATWNQNRITKLNASDDESYFIRLGNIGNDQCVQAHAVGHAASSFYVYQTKKNAETGELYIVDQQNPDLLPTDAGYAINEADDKIFYHNPAPDVMLGFNTKFQFYGFDLGLTFRASIGNYVYNSVLQDQLQYVGTIFDAKFNGFHNVLWEAYDSYWTDNCRLRDVADGVLTDYFVQNASFLRCDNITLGYTFDKNVTKGKLDARIYATVSNPFVISGYKGLDPEIASGIDGNMYPRSMTTMLGVNISF